MCQSDILMGAIAHLKSWYAIIILMVPNVWCKFFPQTFSYCSHFLFLIHIWLQFCDRKFPFCDTSSCFEIMDHYCVPGANCCWLFLMWLLSSDLQITHFRRDGIQVPEAEASVASAGGHGGGSLLVARHDPQFHDLRVSVIYTRRNTLVFASLPNIVHISSTAVRALVWNNGTLLCKIDFNRNLSF